MNWSSSDTLKSKLKSILDYRNISYNCEINSYSVRELCYLINKYKIKLHNVDKRDNKWYKTGNIY